MAIGQTNVSMGAVYWEIFRASTPANLTLEYLVLNSRLSDKSKPYDLGDFRNYDGNPTITMSILKADDTDYTYVTASFHKSFDTKFTSTVFYTINKQDGYAPQQQSTNMLGNDIITSVDFSADRRVSDYQVSITLDYCNHAYSTSTTLYVTVPAKVAQTSQAYLHGKQDAEYDNMYNPDFGVARPEYWGYYYEPQYSEYMNGYNAHRMMQA